MSTGAALVAVLGLNSAPEVEKPSLDGEFDGAPALVWERDLPGPLVQAAKHVELGRPLIDGDEILLGSAGQEGLFVLDRYRGTQIHTYDTVGSVQSQPRVSGDLVIVSDAAGYTFCYRRGEREPVWKHYGGAPIVSSPLVDGDVVYVVNVGGAAYALTRADGSLRWRYVHDKDVSRTVSLELYGAPDPIAYEDMILAGFHDGSIVALTKELGERAWQRSVGEGRYTDLIGRPAIVGDDVILSGFSSPLVSIKLDSRNVRWRIDAGGPSDVIVGDDSGFHGGIDGKLRSFDLVNGAVDWEWTAPKEAALTSPLRTEAGLFVGTANGGLFLINEDTGEEEWRYVAGKTIAGFSAGMHADGRQLVAVTNSGRVLSFVHVEDSASFAKDVGELPGELAR